jgi:hypothetical protein
MKTKLSVSAATKLLATEFARQRAPGCRTCTVPMLYWGPSPEGTTGLWYLKALSHCTHGCHTLVAKIWVEITDQHEIENAPDHSPSRRQVRPMKV